nr:alpha/beta fold hydrolase [Actinomadura sp. J1-007]
MRSDGARLAVREYGPAGGPVLVLVHGYPDEQSVWEPVAGILAARFRVVTYDVRGAGGSSRPAGPGRTAWSTWPATCAR